MAWGVLQLGGQFEHQLGDVVAGGGVVAVEGVGVGAGPVVPLDLFGPGVLLAGGVAEGLGDVTDRRSGPVGDDSVESDLSSERGLCTCRLSLVYPASSSRTVTVRPTRKPRPIDYYR
jgi:hypothetical protein